MSQSSEQLETEFKKFRTDFQSLKSEIAKVIVGQDEIVENLLIALIAGGHVLLEGVPGLGKTLLVKTLAESLNADFSRIQFTPDLMPSDLIGTNMLSENEKGERSFQFQKGPIFTNLLLADEINRATPRTQSALLEVMQEQSITVSGTTHQLAAPFFVMATQNPLEMEGTYPLPEAQLDRFLFKLNIPFPSEKEMSSILDRTTSNEKSKADFVVDSNRIVEMTQLARQVLIADKVQSTAVQILYATHPENSSATSKVKQFVQNGASPRGAQGMILAAKIKAILDGRYNVANDDIKAVAKPVLRHRLILNFKAQASRIAPDEIIEEVVSTI